jgi:uncharacterized membrane protein
VTRAGRLAWSLWGLTFALALAVVVLSVLNRDAGVETTWPAALEVLIGVVVLTSATVGALVASRRPRNPIGWILVAGAVPSALGALGEAYAIYALFTEPGSLPGGVTAAWISTWGFILVLFAVPALLFLLFPDGRPRSRRWRAVLWLIVVATAAATIDTALAPTLEEEPFQDL